MFPEIQKAIETAELNQVNRENLRAECDAIAQEIGECLEIDSQSLAEILFTYLTKR